jgi:multiple sugar transport system permease protein
MGTWPKPPFRTIAVRRALLGLSFAAPGLTGFLAFYLYPMAASFYYSFTDLQIAASPHWVGTANFSRMLTDPLFWKALVNSAWLAAIALPASVAVALLIAVLLSLPHLPYRGLFSALFYLPVLLPSVVTAVLWIWMLNPDYGPINRLLAALHLPAPRWFFDPNWTKPGVTLMMIWGVGDMILIQLSGLRNVPRDLYDAAALDGAGPWTKFRRITIPMISPVLLFNLVTGGIGVLQYFSQAYAISEGTTSKGAGAVGGIQNSLLFYGLYVYNNAFRYFKMGYASALAWVLLILTVGLTLLTLRLTRRRVYYEEES